jgi:3-isopropylmalate/(R)-2-methylmalate dehydratase large subunit
MSQTFVQKALARSAGRERVAVGEIIDARPDVVLSHDNTAAIARLFQTTGRDRVANPEQLAVTLDHAVPAPTAQHAENHAEIRRFVAAQGIRHFYEAGRGICHQVLSEEAIVLPGQLILGADSHTPHFGWLGALGAGIGRSEVAALWATGQLWLRVPETIRIELTGSLPAGVTAKDLSLWLLQILGPEAGLYRALEFGGPGLATLSVESRMVIPNMMAESGAKSAYLEPDETVYAWLSNRLAARTGAPIEEIAEQLAGAALYPDPDAEYVGRVALDLSDLQPGIACPDNPANVRPLSEAAGTHIDQAFIGTCTNGRLEDLAAAAEVFGGADGRVRRIASGTRLLIVPASSEVLSAAIEAGYVQTFLAAGAMLGVPGCGPCMGNHLGIPASGEVVISSANRNFRGRMGNPDSAVYLASPAVVAASAVLGRIADPRELSADGRPARRHPPRPLPRLVLNVGAHDIAAQPALPARPGRIDRNAAGRSDAPGERLLSGRVWKYGDDVNTDVIFPGKYTYSIKEEAEMARHALEDLDPDFVGSVQAGDIIVAGRNWGCGSSREQAVTCLKAAGVRAIVAKSFGRIYFRNAVNNGVLPVACPEAVAAIEAGEVITLDLDRCTVRSAAGEFAFPALSDSALRIFSAGGLLSMLRQAGAASTVDASAAAGAV